VENLLLFYRGFFWKDYAESLKTSGEPLYTIMLGQIYHGQNKEKCYYHPHCLWCYIGLFVTILRIRWKYRS
jgi:hypothetical protein